MAHFKANLADIDFNLYEVNRIQDYLGTGPFAPMDVPTARAVVTEVARLAEEEFAASFVDADRQGVRFEDGRVQLPESLKRSLDAYYDGGWDALGLPARLGGFGAPPSLHWAANELLTGANPTAYFYTIGTLMARVIDALGTEGQKAIARLIVERRWGGTMVLTEPDAGSDVGAGTTRAFPVEGDEYRLEGVKRFITSGDDDYHENIIHLVLARPEGAGPGTKGLSMFIVPKYLFGADGTIGERNGVAVTRVEEKMGLKASSTCELTLGEDRPCVGYLVGGKHGGIRQMFHVIEAARMLIGTKSASTLSTAYLNALEFAKERVQGPDLAEAADKTAPRVPIIQHPNVRRMLMLQKAHAEGMRALVFFTAWVQDQAVLNPDDEHWHKLDDLLLPLVKGYSSEKTFELLAQSLQVLGGSGYTKDYPHEQYIRDAKIDTLYEGTTGIQALDLFFRKIVKDRGETLTRLAARIAETVKGGEKDDPLAAEREVLGTALGDTQALVGVLVGHLMAAPADPPAVYKLGLHANALLESMAELVIGWLLLRHAEIALARLAEGGGDANFYAGKVAAARFFARHALPKAALRRAAAELEDGALMDLAEGAF